MTLRDYQEAVNTLLLANSALSLAIGIIVVLALFIIVGLAGQSDLESCLRGVCV